MKDLGAARKNLGMEIFSDRSQRKLFFSQKGYIEKVLSIFGMATAKPIETPSASNACLSITFGPKSYVEKSKAEEEEEAGTNEDRFIDLHSLLTKK
ncbi:hypothetical protein LIER_27849 [Lithospermum erythrorhizon]|uniref:Reverse transcriptase Ty1/copia-type domain-containing protein n=1 Tax=Lithospermum erythrorhizon TaxID=34254 RepID=A0AAV3RGY6_LITER